MQRQFAGGMFFQQIEHRFALAENIAAIALARRSVLAYESQKFRLCHWTARMLRQDLDLLPGCDLLQFDKIRQQPSDRHGFTDRQLRAPAVGHLQSDLVGGKKTEATRHRIHQRRIVARDDA